jgi:hypothetical protein
VQAIRNKGAAMDKGRVGAALALCGVLAATSALAEVIVITGEFPATYREASFLDSLHVDRIGGQDGQQLAMAIERALGDGDVPFELVGGRAGRDRAEGSLTGVVTTGVEETNWRRKDEKCIERDAKDKCVKKEQVEIPCKRRVVNLSADLRIVRNTDGRIVYSKVHPYRDETSWCQGQSPYRTVEDSVRTAIGGIAANVRREIAPSVETYRPRIRETTKGMPKDLAKAFKATIKPSQRDMAGACATWAAMDKSAPGQPSIVYNLGLCAEQRGDYQGALGYYQQAQRAGASEAGESYGRAQRLIAGKQDAAERARRQRRN